MKEIFNSFQILDNLTVTILESPALGVTETNEISPQLLLLPPLSTRVEYAEEQVNVFLYW